MKREIWEKDVIDEMVNISKNIVYNTNVQFVLKKGKIYEKK